MSNLSGQVGELGLTIQITRKETGQVEEYQLRGFVDEAQFKALQQEAMINQSKEN